MVALLAVGVVARSDSITHTSPLGGLNPAACCSRGAFALPCQLILRLVGKCAFVWPWWTNRNWNGLLVRRGDPEGRTRDLATDLPIDRPVHVEFR